MTTNSEIGSTSAIEQGGDSPHREMKPRGLGAAKVQNLDAAQSQETLWRVPETKQACESIESVVTPISENLKRLEISKSTLLPERNDDPSVPNIEGGISKGTAQNNVLLQGKGVELQQKCPKRRETKSVQLIVPQP